jgi:hypothetical protein
MDLLAEYDEMKTVPTHVAVVYKFFAPFRFENGDLMWGAHRAGAAEEVIQPVKAFLKVTKALLREGTVAKSECSRRMWFWYAKLVDLGLFEHEARLEIMQWMEVCELVIS